MPDEVQVTPEPEAPLSAEEGEDILAAEMASVSSELSGAAKPEAPAATVKPTKVKSVADEGETRIDAKPGEQDTPDADKKTDDIAAAAEAAVKEEQDRANAETVAAAARELQKQREEDAKKATDAAGTPALVDAGAALKEIVDASDGLMIADVDENGDSVQRSFKEWAGMYPGITQAVSVMAVKLAEKVAEARLGAIQSQLEPLVEAQKEQAFDKKRGEVFDALSKPEFGSHEDAQQIVDSTEYMQAIEKAPDAVQKCAMSWDPARQKLALEWYKAKAGIKSATVQRAEGAHRRANMTASAGLRSAGKPIVKDGDELSDAEAKRLFDEALAEGIKA
jgi:hypothetical protein